MYKYPIALTQQFKFCGNPFRIDLYKGIKNISLKAKFQI